MMFASKTPRDLNHDPRPYVRNHKDLGYMGRFTAPFAQPVGYSIAHTPRPEFDHIQHNAPNPILMAFRTETIWCAGRHPLSECARLAMHFEEDGDFPDAPAEQRAHARRVLTRIASLKKEPA